MVLRASMGSDPMDDAPMIMQDASTLDLGELNGPLDLTDVVSGSSGAVAAGAGVNGELLFAEGATVNVRLGARRASSREPLIAWAAKPEGINTVTFRCADVGRTYGFAVKDDGLYSVVGLMILVR